MYVSGVNSDSNLLQLIPLRWREPERASEGSEPPMNKEVSRFPMYQAMMKVPGGLMLLPLIAGSLIGTFAPEAIEIGGFTTALFKNSALPLIALLIFATGTQVNMRTGGPILATAGTILLTKTLVPATIIVILGSYVGLDGVLGVSILAMLAAFDNSN